MAAFMSAYNDFDITLLRFRPLAVCQRRHPRAATPVPQRVICGAPLDGSC